MGLLDRRPGYYRVKITLTILAFLAGWTAFVAAGNSWMTLAVAPLAGVTFTQLGFIGHDAGHNQVFSTRRRNRMLGLAVGNALTGLSFGWWGPKHNAHHAHPNELGRDPDIGEGSAGPSPDAPGGGRGPVASWLPRPSLRRTQGLVADFCTAAGLGYSEESLAGSFRQITRHLSDAGAAASPRPAELPAAAAGPHARGWPPMHPAGTVPGQHQHAHANQHHATPADESAGQPLNRVFERYRMRWQCSGQPRAYTPNG